MRKTLIKCFITVILVVSLIVACFVPSFALSFPPSSSITYSLPFTSHSLINYNLYSSGLFSQVCRLYTVDWSGYPYYWEFYCDALYSFEFAIYTLNTNQGVQKLVQVNVSNNTQVAQTGHFRLFVYDGLSGALVDSFNYLTTADSQYTHLTDVSVPADSVRSYILSFTGYNRNVTPYFSNYCNLAGFSGGWSLINYPASSAYYTWSPFDFSVLNSGGTSSSTGTLTPEYDQNGNLTNYQFDITTDNSDIVNSVDQLGDSLSTPTEQAPDEFESEELDDYTDAVDQSDQALDSFKGNHSFSQLWNNFSLSSFQSSLLFWSNRFEDISDTNPVFPVVIASMLSFGLIAVILNRRVGN